MCIVVLFEPSCPSLTLYACVCVCVCVCVNFASFSTQSFHSTCEVPFNTFPPVSWRTVETKYFSSSFSSTLFYYWLDNSPKRELLNVTYVYICFDYLSSTPLFYSLQSSAKSSPSYILIVHLFYDWSTNIPALANLLSENLFYRKPVSTLPSYLNRNHTGFCDIAVSMKVLPNTVLLYVLLSASYRPSLNSQAFYQRTLNRFITTEHTVTICYAFESSFATATTTVFFD